MIFAAQTLPEGSHSGYVAAAYIVFFALVLIYVAIMSWRLTRVERAVRTLKGTPHDGGQASELHAREHEQERETV
ncbi:MAG TPA: hypothetical protein VGY30_00720 [Solirubrobacteraceae bacterium]|jgi:hypothetical protein|nr:hypothetical protein [Solirubrobacteraceae bacterium]